MDLEAPGEGRNGRPDYWPCTIRSSKKQVWSSIWEGVRVFRRAGCAGFSPMPSPFSSPTHSLSFRVCSVSWRWTSSGGHCLDSPAVWWTQWVDRAGVGVGIYPPGPFHPCLHFSQGLHPCRQLPPAGCSLTPSLSPVQVTLVLAPYPSSTVATPASCCCWSQAPPIPW